MTDNPLNHPQTSEKAHRLREAMRPRSEYGDIEGVIKGLTTHYGKPSLILSERLTGAEIKVVLADRLADDAGESHNWSEVWSGQRVSVLGEITFDPKGEIVRVKALDLKKVQARLVPLEELRKVDILQGRSVSSHINLLREDNND